MRSIFARFLYLTAVTLFLASCATTSLVDSWHSPSQHELRLHKILVVGIFKTANERRIYEDILVSELSQRGVEALPGHTFIPADVKVDRQALENAEKEAHAEAVLTMQTVRIEHQQVLQPGYTTTYPDYWYPPAFPSWNLNGYYGSMTYYEPPYIATYTVANIQTSLFDTRNGKLLWAATIQTSEPGNVISVSKDMAGIVVQSLIKEGMI
ncbi:MAG: DUF4136 domain-containing protein [Geobacter sp.]|nr:MAG: DUF4136 domain-containing protein [Geobacter sp.]